MNHKKFCIANWKMYMDNSDVVDYLKIFNKYPITVNHKKIIICPSYISLKTAYDQNFNNYFSLGAQNISQNANGAYTGEISLSMIEDLKCSYVIIGHSEQRKFNNETDKIINLKLQKIYKSKLTPIICIGESLNQRESNKHFEIVENQITNIFANIDLNIRKDFIIAYEPIWAIGTGISATNDDIKKMHSYIKNIIKNISPNHCNLYLLYGGSVDENNAKSISDIDNVDGFLIGSSSLDAEKFYNIYKQL